MTRTCENCGKLLENVTQRARFCSDKCKMQSLRNKRQGSSVTATPVSVTETPRKHSNEVTVTDQDFIDDAAKRGLVDWYTFDKEVYGRDCWQCGKAYRTRLKLNRYCSVECRDGASGKTKETK